MKKLTTRQKLLRVNKVIKYLEKEIEFTAHNLDDDISNNRDRYEIQFWAGHLNGTKNALSKLQWELDGN